MRSTSGFVAAFVLACALCGARAAPIEPAEIRVKDGNTVSIGQDEYRLVGFDAPDVYAGAKCFAEHRRGGLARARLQQIVDGGRLDFTENTCPCPPGTHGTWFCNYGRKCGTLFAADGENVGLILIREGHARAYTCGKYGCPRRKSWCW